MSLIDQPGVYEMTADEYHADPVAGGSLSSTGARKLLAPSCPAKFRYWADNPQPERKRVFDLGHAAHRAVLGAGAELADIDVRYGPKHKRAGELVTDYLTGDAKEARDAAYDAGKTPLLAREREQVEAMAKALREHPLAGPLFRPPGGRPEQVLVWQDKETGVWCRAMVDFLRYQQRVGRFILADYKTADNASPDKLDRKVADLGYHVQLAFHLMGAAALEFAHADCVGMLVVQEKEPPYLVSVVQLDGPSMLVGQRRAREALRIYAECEASGKWPGYSATPEQADVIGLPPWEVSRYMEDQQW